MQQRILFLKRLFPPNRSFEIPSINAHTLLSKLLDAGRKSLQYLVHMFVGGGLIYCLIVRQLMTSLCVHSGFNGM